MTRPSKSIQKDIFERTVTTLDEMLTFATSVKIQRFIIDRYTRDYSEFEELASVLDSSERISGTGILAFRSDLSRPRSRYEQDFFHDEVAMGSHELGAHIDGFPLEAAATAYLFTLLEIYGNEVAGRVRPGSINKNKAWHEDIKGFADLRDAVQVRKAQEAFAKHFNASASDVPEIAALQMVELKRSRNDFAHDGKSRVNFTQFLHDILAVVCHIAFLTTDEDCLSVYPWEDHHGIFSPISKA